jgi:hypothetical protein
VFRFLVVLCKNENFITTTSSSAAVLCDWTDQGELQLNSYSSSWTDILNYLVTDCSIICGFFVKLYINFLRACIVFDDGFDRNKGRLEYFVLVPGNNATLDQRLVVSAEDYAVGSTDSGVQENSY